MTTYDDVLEGLHERFATVEGLDAEHILDYAPSSIEPITMFSLFEELEEEEKGQVLHTHYFTRHYLCFRWQDNEEAEREMRPYIGLVRQAVRNDPHLGARVNSGWAKVPRAEASFVTIANTPYRTLEFISDVLVKEPIVRSP